MSNSTHGEMKWHVSSEAVLWPTKRGDQPARRIDTLFISHQKIIQVENVFIIIN